MVREREREREREKERESEIQREDRREKQRRRKGKGTVISSNFFNRKKIRETKYQTKERMCVQQLLIMILNFTWGGGGGG